MRSENSNKSCNDVSWEVTSNQIEKKSNSTVCHGLVNIYFLHLFLFLAAQRTMTQVWSHTRPFDKKGTQ